MYENGRFVPSKIALIALLLSSMLMLMGGAAVAPALPLIEAAFPGQDFAVSLIITLPALAVAVTGFGMGYLADRHGKVRTLCASLIIFTIFGMASFFLNDLAIILVMRFVLGIGIAGISMAVTALMAEYYAGADRVKVLSYQSAAMGIGVLILEYTGGSLAAYSWHEPFLVYLIGVPILLLCILSMREPDEMERPVKEAIAKGPADKTLIAICYATIFICQTMSFLLPTKMPTFLEDPELPGYITASMVGLFLGAHGITNTVVSLFYRRISSAIRPFFVMSLGFLVMGASMVVFLMSPTVVVALGMMILVGLGMGLVIPAVTNTLAGQATSSTSGKIMGGYSTFLNLGQFSISLISVPLLSMVDGSIPSLFGIMGGLALVIGVMFVIKCAKDRRFSSDGLTA